MAKLTQEALTDLNKQVTVDGKDSKSVAGAWLAANGLTSGGTSGNGITVKVGSTNFYEQEVLGEIFAQILEANGFTVERKFQLGNREVVFPALQKGDIDILAEYAATALEYVNKGAGEATGDAAETVAKLKDRLAPLKLTALDFAPATDQNGFVVTKATADKYKLTKAQRPGQPRAVGADPTDTREDPGDEPGSSDSAVLAPEVQLRRGGARRPARRREPTARAGSPPRATQIANAGSTWRQLGGRGQPVVGVPDERRVELDRRRLGEPGLDAGLEVDPDEEPPEERPDLARQRIGALAVPAPAGERTGRRDRDHGQLVVDDRRAKDPAEGQETVVDPEAVHDPDPAPRHPGLDRERLRALDRDEPAASAVACQYDSASGSKCRNVGLDRKRDEQERAAGGGGLVAVDQAEPEVGEQPGGSRRPAPRIGQGGDVGRLAASAGARRPTSRRRRIAHRGGSGGGPAPSVVDPDLGRGLRLDEPAGDLGDLAGAPVPAEAEDGDRPADRGQDEDRRRG